MGCLIKLRDLQNFTEGCELNLMNKLLSKIDVMSENDYFKSFKDLNVHEMHSVVSKAIMSEIYPKWKTSIENSEKSKKAFYFSAEFLIGRLIYNNLFSLGILKDVKEAMKLKGIDINIFEAIDDPALGNGGLGRLAACFLDSAATHDIPLDGYGIRYKYGLFKQKLADGFQVETADTWQKHGDPWSIRKDSDTVEVEFADMTVLAVPYDMPIIGYKSNTINTLRLWQSESVCEFDFEKFNNQDYIDAIAQKSESEDISMVLYPNDSTTSGKILRLRQQYFFTSASLQDIIRKYKIQHGDDFLEFPNLYAIQLNDTHPVIAIPEMIRLLQLEGIQFSSAFEICQKVFSYTNHTVMSEALETWYTGLVQSILPDIYDIILKINDQLIRELTVRGLNRVSRAVFQNEPSNQLISKTKLDDMKIIDDGKIHMARLAVYVCNKTNGVAKIHTEIIKNDVFKDFYETYPQRFQNKTNGITQRRWLGLCNPELSMFITNLIGENWLKDLAEIKKLGAFINDDIIVQKFNDVKYQKKAQLSEYIKEITGEDINPNFIFDIQIKRLHEYKRQLMNAFSILDIYFKLKNGRIKNFNPTAFIFAAKAAPGYKRAKTIIKYINEVAKFINNDPETGHLIKVVFLPNYNVSMAEKLIPACDVSEQISTAGTEASGTSNMKFMLNGSVTLGTFDGANIEIVEQAGLDNNYIFGAKIDEINKMKTAYVPKRIYDTNSDIRKVLNTLIDGTFNESTSESKCDFKDIFDSLIKKSSFEPSDKYFLLYDLPYYVDLKLKTNRDYKDRIAFGRKCLNNISAAGVFSSDRAIKEYAKDIWNL